ncbi:MAG TPA: hypothetical protein VGV41_09605 [Pseudolabrys sp.]|jgi:hypothetical protein|uniref:hypothetical protein n=1 Tax=Pseudolabrys sp. TaxID=1960880 RepID=UPI002DDDAD17|nr:hypothetical protein [Pseudolabrys sp.]HEV2628884.1 hypothetical protein [Pseudolabrys sp.]
MTETLKVIGHFIFQIIVGAVLFGIFAGVATIISLGAHWIEGLGAPYEIVLGCHVIEILLFLADMVCFVFFIFVEVWKLLKEMALGLKKGGGHV